MEIVLPKMRISGKRSQDHQEEQTTREVQKLQEKNGHTIYSCLQPQFTIRKAVVSIVRERYGQQHDDFMDHLDVNMAIWCIFLNATHRAVVHLGQSYEVNLRFVKNHLWNSVKTVVQ